MGSPYEEFQRWKTHPAIRDTFEGGTCISYGARCINEGGLQSVPKLTFPGGMLIGCSAGFVNVPKVKGSHTAMKSGILAAEAIFESVSAAPLAHEEGLGDAPNTEITEYEASMKSSWVWDELSGVRNVHPSFKKGLWLGMAYSGLDQFVLRGKAPWTFRNDRPDSQKTKSVRMPEN